MKIAERFGRLLARFWPLWLPLVLLFVLPWSRPMGRLVSDDVVGEFTRILSGNERVSPMPAASAHPADVDLQLWHGWKLNQHNYDYSDSADSRYAEMRRLNKKFPTDPLLIAPPLQHEMGLASWVESWYDYRPPATLPAELARELKMLRAAALSGQKLEPNNAFWWVALAHIEWRSKRYDASLRALEQSAKCPRYDDYTLDLARRLVRARQRYSAPTFFEKHAIMQYARSADGTKLHDMATPWSLHARRLRTKGQPARALRWARAMIVVGDLMQRGSNSLAGATAGAHWQSEAYSVGYPAQVTGSSPRGASYFAQFARANGRPDLAQLTPQLAAHSRQVRAMTDNARGRNGEQLWLQRDTLGQWVSLIEGLPFVLTMNLIYLGLWWLTANLLLWRAHGAPSSRRDRVGLAMATMSGLILLGSIGIQFFVSSSGGAPSPLDNLMGSLSLFAFFGAPFVLALSCALKTLKRYRARFALPPRVDMEMALSPWARTFLRWFLPLCVMSSIAILALGWALWLIANWRGWANVDLLKWLPPDRNGATGSMTWDFSEALLMLPYGIVMCCGCLLVWFYRWRWTLPSALRPLTQGALRWWKEALGIAMVTISWLFLLSALASSPLINQADARMESVWQVGELEVK